jgi:hypothetical protein
VRISFGVAYLVTAALLGAGVFLGLPTRWAVVDVGGGLLALLLFATGAGLVLGRAFATRLARPVSWAALAVGVLVIALLSSSAGYLRGAYGPVGQGGALIFVFVIALVFPYLVALPCACLVWLGPRKPLGSQA